MEEQKFTHLAKIYGFKCYYNIHGGDVLGTNWFNELMIDIFVWIDVNFTNNEGFKIEIIEEL